MHYLLRTLSRYELQIQLYIKVEGRYYEGYLENALIFSLSQ